MFSKKCPRCARKLSKEFDFCPYCGLDFRMEKMQEREKDYGLLGRDDLTSSLPNFGITLPSGLGNLFSSLLKEVDKQFKELDRDMTKEKQEIRKIKPASGISISISTSNGKEPEIKVRKFGEENTKQEKEIKIEKPVISDKEARKLSKLPRKEAKTEVRRMSNKIIYEIELPGVKNIKDIIINKLENSIEIKAFSRDKAYFKLLPVKLPITNYRLEDEKLVLELSPK